MLPITYTRFPYAKVDDVGDFFKTNLPEMLKVKAIYEGSKLMLNLPSKKVALFVAEGERIYKYIFLSPGVNDIPFGYAFYLPLQKRLDLFVDPPEMSAPIIQWRGKKVEFKNYPMLYDKVGFDALFNKISNNL